MLEFWTTWCPYCFTEAPFVDKINQEYGDKGLLVLTINVGESKKTVKKYLDQHPRKTRIILTDDTNLAAMYEAVEYPIYVVIERTETSPQRSAERQEKRPCESSSQPPESGRKTNRNRDRALGPRAREVSKAVGTANCQSSRTVPKSNP